LKYLHAETADIDLAFPVDDLLRKRLADRAATPFFPGTVPASIAMRARPEMRGAAGRVRLRI
jgi:hypothetical protein